MIDLQTFNWRRAVLLAPMEDVTDLAYRGICRELGAELVYTEFVNSDGLVRGCKRGMAKLCLSAAERPCGIQLYGHDTENMVRSAELAMQQAPELIDINAGCWVKKVSRRGAGAGLLKDPCYMAAMAARVVKAVPVPVTVKTRLGWDAESINIIEVAQRLEDVGVRALTIHCRTRAQGHSGTPDWSWIARVKEKVTMPIIINGGILSAMDAMRAFTETPADGVMIARGAIGRPWIFRELSELLRYGELRTPSTIAERVELCLRHLQRACALNDERRAILAFRKYYSGYFKSLPGSAELRRQLMQQGTYDEVAATLRVYETTTMFVQPESLATPAEAGASQLADKCLVQQETMSLGEAVIK